MVCLHFFMIFMELRRTNHSKIGFMHRLISESPALIPPSPWNRCIKNDNICINLNEDNMVFSIGIWQPPLNKITPTYKANPHPESNFDPSPSKTSLLEKGVQTMNKAPNIATIGKM